MKIKKLIHLTLCICMLLSLTACGGADTSTPTSEPERKVNYKVYEPRDYMRVHFLDVGQGDCAFIELATGETMLIDAGNAHNAADIIQYIRDLGYSEINYVVATHPHADHIGGMAEVLKAFPIDEMYMPNQSHTSKTFENLLDTIDEEHILLFPAKTGKNIVYSRYVNVKLLSPSGSDYQNVNNCSAVVKITYGETTFLFEGDAEQEIEAELLDSDIKADVLKVGHHGSETSSSESFINAVSPKSAIISCGAGNSYGHPSSQTLTTLKNAGADIYRTDEAGTIIVTADNQKHISIDKKASEIKENAPPSAVASKENNTVANSNNTTSTAIVYRTKTGKKYHRGGCSYLKSKIETTVSEAKARGLEPCLRCKPPR